MQDEAAMLRERIESLEESIEHWKRELAIEDDPEYRKRFINNIRGCEEQKAQYQERLQKLPEPRSSR
jgi:TATA-binding protein-associated factor Taf7